MNTQKPIRLLKPYMGFNKGHIYTPSAGEAQILVMAHKAEYYVEDIHQSPLNRAMSAVTAATTAVRGRGRPKNSSYEVKSDERSVSTEGIEEYGDRSDNDL